MEPIIRHRLFHVLVQKITLNNGINAWVKKILRFTEVGGIRNVGPL